jgi:hypothetical protein
MGSLPTEKSQKHITGGHPAHHYSEDGTPLPHYHSRNHNSSLRVQRTILLNKRPLELPPRLVPFSCSGLPCAELSISWRCVTRREHSVEIELKLIQTELHRSRCCGQKEPCSSAPTPTTLPGKLCYRPASLVSFILPFEKKFSRLTAHRR